MPEMEFFSDGSFDQSAWRPCHPPFDAVELTDGERRVIDRTEAWIRTAHEKLHWRCTRMDPTNDQMGLQVALPRTLNEIYTWRKVFDRDPLFPVVMDKVAVKDWLRRSDMPVRAPEQIWAGTIPAAIPAAALERPAVAKAAHGWGSQLFVRPGETTLEDVRAAAAEFMTHRHGWRKFEWGYDPIPARILIEEEVRPAPGRKLEEVKVYVFGDRIEQVLRIFDRFGEPSGQLWEADAAGRVRLTGDLPEVTRSAADDPVPATWREMMASAFALAAPFDHVRVDFLTDGVHVVLGEMTIYNSGGRMPRIGADPAHPAALAWDLRRSWFLRTAQSDPELEEYRLTLSGLLDRLAPDAGPRDRGPGTPRPAPRTKIPPV